MPQNGCHVHPGKAKPSPTPTWVRLGLMGSLLGFPEVRAGLGRGFLGQGQSVVTPRVPGDSSITCWCLGRQRCVSSPGTGLRHLTSHSVLLVPFQKRSHRCR